MGEQPLEQHGERPVERVRVRDLFREGKRLTDLGGRPARRDAARVLAAGESPCVLAVRPEAIGDRRAREPGELAQAADPHLGHLTTPVGRERKQVERQWLEEERRLPIVHDDHAPLRCDARRCEGCEPPRRGADPRPPPRSHGVERAAERRVEASGEPLDATGLEVCTAGLGGLDREPGALQAAKDALPLVLDSRGVLLHEHEPRAGREGLAEAHPRPDARPLRCGGARPDGVTLAGARRERRRPSGQLRSRAQSRSEGESRNRETGDHGTHVLYEQTFSCQEEVGTNPYVFYDRV